MTCFSYQLGLKVVFIYLAQISVTSLNNDMFQLSVGLKVAFIIVAQISVTSLNNDMFQLSDRSDGCLYIFGSNISYQSK